IGIWAEQQIRFSAARHLFEGVGNHLFDPNGSMTRGMFVTVLHRMVGCPAPKAASDFKDVPKGIWYEKAVAWASENGIVEGYSNDMFAPDDLTTREQMCALFARYLRYAKYELPGQTQPRTFADEQDISAWAKDDMNLCHSIGLIQGRPGNLSAPRDNASRAEGTAVFARLIRTIIETKK
ncbi:MAG: S-layer homology domain-containing protein, partial [Evtepia sp.]